MQTSSAKGEQLEQALEEEQRKGTTRRRGRRAVIITIIIRPSSSFDGPLEVAQLIDDQEARGQKCSERARVQPASLQCSGSGSEEPPRRTLDPQTRRPEAAEQKTDCGLAPHTSGPLGPPSCSRRAAASLGGWPAARATLCKRRAGGRGRAGQSIKLGRARVGRDVWTK